MKQTIGPREAALRAAREAKASSSKRIVGARTAGKKPVKVKKKAKQ